jgi:hypothetical protein
MATDAFACVDRSEAQPFVKGFALVKYQGKYGFINHDGKMVILAQCDAAHSFLQVEPFQP